MIVVKIELWPDDPKQDMKPMGEIHIKSEEISQNKKHGSYHIDVWNHYPKVSTQTWKSGKLEKFKRTNGHFDLVLRAMARVIGFVQ